MRAIQAVILVGGFLALGIVAPFDVRADEAIGPTLTGDEIRAQIVGNSYKGIADNGTPYIEYLHPKGRIRAEGYFGNWSINGDKLCLDYDRGNAFDGCWGIALKGTQITWLKGTTPDGTATLIPGNPDDL